MYLPSPGRPVCGPVQARAAGTGFDEVAAAEAVLDTAAVGEAVPVAVPVADAEGVAAELAEAVAEALPDALPEADPPADAPWAPSAADGVQPVMPRPSTPKPTAPRPKVPIWCNSSRRPMEAWAESPDTVWSVAGVAIAD